MAETQASITEWMEATFPGADPASPRKALRLMEEVVELCLAAGAAPSAIRETVISTLHKCCDKVQDDHESRPLPDKVPGEAADVAIILNGFASTRRFVLQDEIDDKMKINRGRTWAPRGDGTGYHVNPKQE